ncbi:MAG: histidine--tRNA ligase [Holosporales bacterium]|jgi:histidyl-tRNA synthetase|nr:histidine--tRNA ligase [Holosporales bacterium]
MSNLEKFGTVRGMRDLIGSDANSFRFIIRKLEKLALDYGYNFLETPILEKTSLFVKGIGEETDVVGKEMFSFLDRSENSLSLRPEGTASTVRALISNNLTQDLPQKLFYYGPMFRYDRPQKGRYRQFYQFGIECIGSDSPISDVEIIAFTKSALDELKIHAKLIVNTVGDKETREKYKQVLVEYLKKYEKDLSEDSVRRLKENPLRILDSKDSGDKKICEGAPLIFDYLSANAINFISQVTKGLKTLGIEYDYTQRLVRGLDYYDHTVFEFIDQDGLALCGGGRYNSLVKNLEGPDISAVGMAFGVDRLIVACGDKYGSSGIKIAVLNVTEAELYEAFKIATDLRTKSIGSILFPTHDKLTKKLRYCDKADVLLAIIIGEDEVKTKTVNIKFLKDLGEFKAGQEISQNEEDCEEFIFDLLVDDCIDEELRGLFEDKEEEEEEENE